MKAALSDTIRRLLARDGAMAFNVLQTSTGAEYKKEHIAEAVEGLVMSEKVRVVDGYVVPHCPVTQRLNTRIWDKAVMI